MMNGPYYRNYSRSVPVQKPKVVSIPVHFISSSDHQPQLTNKHSSSSAALKIQKVFKGHTVRKALNKVVSIKNQVDDIEKRLQNDVGFVKMLRNDAKERLRVNETLMSLLFKLDSVRGVENGVRDVRKSVAKKAVSLQEKVDSIAQGFEEDDDDVTNNEKAELGDVRNGEDVDDDVINDEKTELCDVSDGIPNHVNEDDVDDDVSNKNRNQELVVNDEAMAKNEEDSIKECNDDVSRNNVIDQSFEDCVDDVSNGEYVKDVLVDDDVSNNVGKHESVDNSKEDVKGSLMKQSDDDVSRSCCDEEIAVNEDRKCGDDDVINRCCDREMVEKLICDNAKMMKLMIQISERNEMQTRMINSLSKRVEHLEKAFIMSDKSRRRKKNYARREKDSFCI